MLDFLTQVQAVLTGDAQLTAKVPTSNIGVNLRKKPDQPAIEYGLDGGSIEPGKKEIQSLRVTVYGTTSAEDTVWIADRVVSVLTPKALSDATKHLHCGLCKKTRNALLPVSDFGHQVELTFQVLLSNHPPSV